MSPCGLPPWVQQQPVKFPGPLIGPLPLSCRWQRRAHCRHQGRRLCLGEPPWRPRTANAAAATPGRVAASRGAAISSASSTSSLHSSSTSSCERASREAARRDVPAARAHVCRLLDGDPRGGTVASSSLSRPDFGNSAGRIGFIYLDWSPVIFSFQAVLLSEVPRTPFRTPMGPIGPHCHWHLDRYRNPYWNLHAGPRVL